jgi:hypothetical protein
MPPFSPLAAAFRHDDGQVRRIGDLMIHCHGVAARNVG